MIKYWLSKSIKEINCFLKNEGLTFKDFIPFYINCIGSLKTGGISSDGSSFLNKEILNQKIKKKKKKLLIALELY